MENNQKTGFIKSNLEKMRKGCSKVSEKIIKRDSKVRFSIRYKILLSFLVPVFFIIVVGIASYSKAETGITEKYESSTLETVKMAAEHIDLASKYLRADGMRFAMDDETNSFFKGSYDDDYILFKNTNDTILNSMQTSLGANNFLKNIHLVTRSDATVRMYSTKSNQVNGIMESYWEEMKDPENDRNIINWIGRHESLDTALNFIDSDDYFFSYQELAANKSFIVVIDVSTDAIQDFIDNIDLGEGSVVSIVSMNGRELIHETPAEGEKNKYSAGTINFAEQEFYKEAVNSVRNSDGAETSDGIKEVNFDGEDCIFFYAPCEASGCMICALIPSSTVVAQARSIGTLTVSLVVIALIVVIGIGLFITASIQKNVKKVSLGLDEVAKGNLTVSIDVKANDEFMDLAGAANDMVTQTKKLVSKVDAAVGGLQGSADDVRKAARVLDSCSGDISHAVSDINDGMKRQSSHADECVITTDRLSDEIKNVSVQVEMVKDILKETSGMINESVKLVKALGDKALETTTATDDVDKAVRALADEAKKIVSFVGVIKNISGQTRLLSLNASIEAAHAGVSGKGFGVIAEQIRKLSNDSTDAAGEIDKLVEGINNQAESTAKSTEQAHDIVDLQSDLINDAIGIFEAMQTSVSALSEKIGSIDTATLAADTRRAETVNAVRNIAGIINDNADNTRTVMEVALELKNNIEKLNNTALKLGTNMDEIKNEVAVFKL